jgi:hypothetical protein
MFKKCSNTVHVICGKTNGEEGFGRSVLGFLTCGSIHVTLSVFPVPETPSVISIMSKSFLTPVCVISLRSSSVLIFEIISACRKVEQMCNSRCHPNLAYKNK